MPWDGANGLLPGRGAPVPRSFSPRPRGRGMPWEVANGLLPGRAAGRGAPGRGALLRPPSVEAAGFSASGALGPGRAPGLAPGDGAAAVSAAGADAAGAAGAGAAASAGAGAEGAGAAGAGAAGAAAAGAEGAGAGAAGAGAAGAADGRGPGVPAFSAGLDSGFDADAGKAPRSFLTTGASIVDEAERTNSPSSCSFATASFEVMPSSLASSCTRTLATFLLSRSAPSQVRTVYFLRASTAGAAKPITEHNKALIAGYSSGFHQISDPLSGWTVSSPLPVGASSRALNQASASAVSTEPRKARLKACRRSAAAKHAVPRCTQAPRPDIRRRSSTRTAILPSAPTAANRISTAWSSVFLHPMHVLIGTCAAAPEAAGDKKKAEGDPASSILTRFSPCAASTRKSLVLRRSWRRKRCQFASRSALPPAGRSALPCRWPAKAGNREQPPVPNVYLRR